ncbi:MAG: NAD-dependent epimerase/dehydratase family protein [Bacteroidia bacterium]
MKIFITGATGFIGGRLALKLAMGNNIVHVLYRTEIDNALKNHPNIKLFEGDLFNKKKLTEAMQGCTQVYHAAGYARVWANSSDMYYKINVEGTVNVMQCTKLCGVEKIVFTSSGSTLASSVNGMVNEDDALMHNLMNDYERSKFAAESIVKDFALRGQHIVMVNPTRVFGPGNLTKSNFCTYMIYQYLKGKWRIIPGNGKFKSNYVFIDDVVNGHLLAMQRGKPGERYLLGGENAGLNEFFGLLKNVSVVDHRLIHIPMPIIYGFAYMQLWRAKLFGIDPSITPVFAGKNNYDWSRNCDKAVNELQYETTPLEAGIRKTVEWLKASQPDLKWSNNAIENNPVTMLISR